MKIVLHIDRLVLRGLGAAAHIRLLSDLQAELEWLAAGHGTATATGTARSPGQQIAHAVFAHPTSPITPAHRAAGDLS